ncbi:virion core cysteine protease [Mythimna separata entomopoxvirus 'L']|uniref:Virion core cysteine protease n=1 Tax=Mythimna separata entomopoxvirus 'L' TaxID=1293572 RepID=A0A916KQJ4_9POXV|nr:virion core cysteine protease [Mythimna separata entomopoxvirus 'L']CCU56415.1 virion core cysteine protease [Mythimna separata entomopoxvirus 'L']
MNNKIRRFPNKNLKMPESGINFMSLLIFSKTDAIYFINPIKYNTNANMAVLERIDDDVETRGKVTFLPIDYLEMIYKEISIDPDHINTITFSNKIKKKFFLFWTLKEYLKQQNKNINTFINSKKYKGIPLVYLRKSFLKSELSKTRDFSTFATIHDDLDIQIGLPLGFNPKPKSYPRQHNKSTWLSSGDIYNCIYPLTLINTDYDYFHLVLFERTDKNIAVVASSMKTYRLEERINLFLNTNKRFFMFPIIYNDHFTCCIIDKNFGDNKKAAYFFNSSGYMPESIKFNKKYMFIESDMTIKNHKRYITTPSTDYKFLYIDVLSNYLDDVFGNINLFFFNTYELQYDSPDCGMFNIIFMYYIVYFNIKTPFEFKKLYYSMSFIGDLLASSYRGALFISKYDINSIEEFKNTLDTFYIKNKKFLELIDMYKKNSVRIMKICGKIEDDYNTLLNDNDENKEILK